MNSHNEEIKLEQKESQSEGIQTELSFQEMDLLLADAIFRENEESALYYINEGANVNALLCTPKYMKISDKDILSTPLHFAIQKLNYNLTKLLLENGANPNIINTEGSSTLELLLLGLETIAMSEMTGENEEYTPKFLSFLHIDKKFKRPIKLLKEHHEAADQILDLLLAYGMNKEINWSSKFLELQQVLQENAEVGHAALKKHAAVELFPQTIKITTKALQQIKGTEPSLKSKGLGFLYNSKYWIKKTIMKVKNEGKEDIRRSELLDDLKATQDNLSQYIDKASAQIDESKSSVQKKLQNDIQTAISRPNQNFPIPLAVIICDFLNISAYVHQQRKQAKLITPFWRQIDYREQTKKDYLQNVYIVNLTALVGYCLSMATIGNDVTDKEIAKVTNLTVGYAEEKSTGVLKM